MCTAARHDGRAASYTWSLCTRLYATSGCGTDTADHNVAPAPDASRGAPAEAVLLVAPPTPAPPTAAGAGVAAGGADVLAEASLHAAAVPLAHCGVAPHERERSKCCGN